MQGQNLSEICNSVIRFFKKTATELGISTGFVQRKSKLDSSIFVESLVMGYLSSPTNSLERICELMKQRGARIKKQSLHERFTPRATEFMQKMFVSSLQKFKMESEVAIDLLKQFTSVNIIDSSTVALPKKLKHIYPGYGGDAAEAALKVQVMMNYAQNQIENTWITGARNNDQGFNEHLREIKAKGLYLQDLGYYKLNSFKAIQDNRAFFISKYLHPTAIFTEQGQPLNLLKSLRRGRTNLMKKVLLGQKNRLPVRLIACKLSKEDAKRSIQRIKTTGRKHGYTPSKISLELARWSILVTNVPESMLSDEQSYLVYSLRWQIELLFKLCKSEAGLDKTNSEIPDRVLCEIYAKLICVVILMYICLPIRWKEAQEISLRKAFKQLSQCAKEFLAALQSRYRLIRFLKERMENMMEFALKDKRKNTKPSTYQKLMAATGQEVLA